MDALSLYYMARARFEFNDAPLPSLWGCAYSVAGSSYVGRWEDINVG